MTTPKKSEEIVKPVTATPHEEAGPEIIDPTMRAVIKTARDVTLEDIENLRDARISDTDAKQIAALDVLHINDDPNDPQIGHLKFAWLAPSRRAKVGMSLWQWVKGDLAKLVREKHVVQEVIGGGSATSVITTGDLMLAFMLRDTHSKLKAAQRRTSDNDVRDIASKKKLEEDLDLSRQEVDRRVKRTTTYEGREV